MKVTVINGNMRRGSTWHCMDLLLGALARFGEVERTEFFLPKDMPHFCNGCFSCIYNGEHTCPHAEAVQPIVRAMLSADVVVLTSPVYAMDVSGQMKALLDHLCYMWMSHRPNPAMFDQIGVTISTTAGAGLKQNVATLRNSLRFWGVKRLYSFRSSVSAKSWKEVSPKRQARIRRDTEALAGRIAGAALRAEKLSPPLFRRFFLWIMRGMMSKNTWNPTDRRHWEAQGWIAAAPEQSGEA